MKVDVTDGRGVVVFTVQFYYDLGRQWVATVVYSGRPMTRHNDLRQEADGPEWQIAFDNLKAKMGF